MARRPLRWLVAGLLQLYPPRFRRRFAADALSAFDQRWRDRPGVLSATRILADLVRSAALEWLTPARRGVVSVATSKGDSGMTILWQDLRYSARTLAKSPGFALVALATLALGIGVNAAMFSVAHAVLWQSLPYPNADQLVTAGEVDGKTPDRVWGAAYPSYRDWQSGATSLAGLAATMRDSRILREGSEPVQILGAAVTGDFFRVMGVEPLLGRTFTAEEDRAGASPVVILSHRSWTSRFGADPAIVGKAIRFGGSSTVVGVMPPRFDWPQSAEYWAPLAQTIPQRFSARRDVWALRTVGRLQPGKTASAARAELVRIGERINQDHPETRRGLVMQVDPLRSELGRDLRPALLALLGAVGMVLLIACGNLAGLMLVRAGGRAREMAIRSALGAGKRRLIRQILTECALLSIGGGAAGIALAAWAVKLVPLVTKDSRLANIPLDTTVLLFALIATAATCLLFGIVPALRAARTDANGALKTGGRGGLHRERASAQQLLVAGEVALCVVLLVGAGLLYSSFRRVLSVDPGFRTENLLTLRVALPRGYPTVAAVNQFYARIPEQLGSIPGVIDSGLVTALPISGGDSSGDITIEGRPSAPGENGGASFRRASPNYFRVMGIPLLRGREFDQRDDGSRGRVVIITESMARRFWPNDDPVGRRIKIGPADNEPWVTIVGVVRDVRHVGLDAELGFATYEPLAQQPWSSVQVAVRTSVEPSSAISAVRAELRRMEPALLIDGVESMSQRIGESVSPRRLNLTLFGLFAGLALLLAAVGLYGVVAYAAGQRTQEFGVRMALGAQPRHVLWMVLRQGARLALAGLVAGLAVAVALARLLSTLLFQVSPADPLTLLSVAGFVALVTLVACWAPALRATHITPTEALRNE